MRTTVIVEKRGDGGKMKTEVKKYLAEIGKKGGSVTSEKKAEASRKNGLRGGRKSVPVILRMWVRTPNDTSRWTASDTTSASLTCNNAVAIARDLDANGERSKYEAIFPPRKVGYRLACQHGVSVEYMDGRIREVHAKTPVK